MSQSVRVTARWLLAWLLLTLVVARISNVPELRIAHGVLAYLMLIVGASREGGWRLATLMVLLGYASVDYYFVPPRRTFGRASDFDLIILIGFVVTSAVVARLVIRLRATAALASARADAINAMSEERVRLARLAARADVLQEAERLKDALLASVSHDLRSPVTSLMMLSDPETPMAPHDALRRVNEQATRLARFLTALDRFRTTSAPDRPLPIETHAVGDIVLTLVSAMHVEIGERQVLLHPATPAGLHVRCDFTLTLQVLGNLLQNALRYSPAPSPIEVSVTLASAEMVRIRLSDRGPGVAAEEVEAIFAPLRRGREAASADEGTGMGLAIARTFARAQGGDVRHEPRDGGGAHFDLLLPRGAPEPGPVIASRVESMT